MIARIVFVVLVCASATSVFAQRSQTSAPNTAQLSGVVTVDAVPVSPIRGAIVTISGAALSRARSTVTDDDGRFVFANLPAGQFAIKAAKAPFIAMTYGARQPERQGTEVQLTSGQHVDALTIRLPRGAVLTGLIRDHVGAGVADQTVYAIRTDGSAVGPPVQAATDDRGIYRLFGLTPGSYLVVVTPKASVVNTLAMPSEADVDRIFAELRMPASVPAGHVAVTPPAPPTPFGLAATFYPGVPSTSSATIITIRAGEERSGLDFSVVPVHTAVVEGVVSSKDGQPPVGVAISLSAAGLSYHTPYGLQPALTTAPGRDGRFKFTNVAPGKYVLMARANATRTSVDDPQTPTQMIWAVTEINTGGEDVTDVSLTLQSSFHVKGRVEFQSRARPVSDVRVNLTSLRPTNDETLFSVNMPVQLEASVKSDNTFDVASVMPGPFAFTTAGVSSNWWLRSAMLNGRDILDDRFVVNADTEGLTLTFSDQHSEVSGLLQRDGAVPSTEYFVVLFTQESGWWRAGARRVTSTRPASDGRFTFRDIPAGEYFLAVLTDVTPEDLADRAFLQDISSSAMKVSVAEGEKKTIDLRIGGRGSDPPVDR